MALGSNLTKTKKPTPSNQDIKTTESKTADQPEQSDEASDDRPDEDRKETEQYCIFLAGDQEYALPIQLVKEVIYVPNITLLPAVPAYIEGVANVRGSIYGILDVAKFFTNNATSTQNAKYILVMEHEDYMMSILIPSVPETLKVSDDMIESLSGVKVKTTTGQKYLKGIIRKDKRLIVVFDIIGMISGERFTQVE